MPPLPPSDHPPPPSSTHPPTGITHDHSHLDKPLLPPSSWKRTHYPYFTPSVTT
ncbi:hypothetical protein L873DRAFT_1815710 [Choiromyces venosus 120613-1]|uniref:Uncharacterized protein n=1 Tax=Choiromyces venosus 120613-1 TaxID=1336337 RepID=A0A3N4J8B9_9PEZI|nr:hypothetical protein L873DRAFT_1815710 [Choiromyces venosus 120613-1]